MALTGARVEALPGHHQPSRPLGQAAVVLWPCTEGAPFHAGRVAESTRQPPPPWGSSHSQPIPKGMAVQMYNPQEHNPRSRTNFRVSEAEDWGGGSAEEVSVLTPDPVGRSRCTSQGSVQM